MNERFVLFYTGAPRQSGINNWEVFKQHINGDKQVIQNFAEIRELPRPCIGRWLDQKWDDVERLIAGRVGAAAHECARHQHSTH